MSDGVRTIVRHIRDTVHHGRRLRVLVLGDPQASTCQQLTLDGHDVWCCPDRQRSEAASHPQIAANTLDDLVDSATRWDLVVAVDGFRRMQQVHRVDHLRTILSQFAATSHALLVEAPRRVLAPDLHDLGPYLGSEYLASFLAVTEIPLPEMEHSGAAPLLLASNHGFFLSDAWLSADTLSVQPSTRAHDATVVRTFESGNTVIKVELANEGYFDQCDVVAEGDFLKRAPERVRAHLGLPHVVDLHRGRAVNVLVRERVEGTPLSPGICARGEVPLQSVIDIAARLSSCGLFHNDFRPWNLLWTGSEMRVIDYADISDVDLDVQGIPQVLALAGTLAALASPALPWGPGFVPALLDLTAESGVWARWSEGDLIGNRRPPWLAVHEARDGLITRLSPITDWSDSQIVEIVIDEIMTMHQHENGH